MKKFTIFYQLLALASIVFMLVNMYLNSNIQWFDIDLAIFLFVPAFIVTYWKSYVKMYKEEKATGEKCYIVFSMCLPIVHLLVGGLYCGYLFCK